MKEGNQQNKKVERSHTIKRKNEIYQKALDLFVKKGYDATPISLITKTLGMSKANLYYYAPAKRTSYTKFIWTIYKNGLFQFSRK